MGDPFRGSFPWNNAQDLVSKKTGQLHPVSPFGFLPRTSGRPDVHPDDLRTRMRYLPSGLRERLNRGNNISIEAMMLAFPGTQLELIANALDPVSGSRSIRRMLVGQDGIARGRRRHRLCPHGGPGR